MALRLQFGSLDILSPIDVNVVFPSHADSSVKDNTINEKCLKLKITLDICLPFNLSLFIFISSKARK